MLIFADILPGVAGTVCRIAPTARIWLSLVGGIDDCRFDAGRRCRSVAGEPGAAQSVDCRVAESDGSQGTLG